MRKLKSFYAGMMLGAMLMLPCITLSSVTAEKQVDIPVFEATAEPRHIVLNIEPEPRPEPAIDEYIEAPMLVAEVEPEPEPVIEVSQMSQKDIELIALVTMAEAEGEPEHGQRLVISTILNRVDSNRFPDTVHGVIYQKNAFSSMWDGRADRCYVREDFVALVKDELKNRTDNETMFFRTGHYSAYGTPMYQYGNHYFSSI